MSYDDYTIHILQKYRLAVTIAVIKTKPENISLEDHIETLRSNLNPEEMDFEDFNISINSDDFKFDETNLFLDNNNENNDMILRNNNLATKINEDAQENAKNYSQHVINISQNELDDVPMYDTQDLNESITILDNFKLPYEEFSLSNTETNQRRSVNEVMDILKGIDDTMVNIDQTKIDQSKFVQEHDVFSQIIDEDLTQCYGDIDITQCESVDINKQHIISKDKYANNDGPDFHKNNEKLTKTNKQKIIQNDKPRVNIGKNSISQINTNTTNQNTKVCDKSHLQEVTFKNMPENKPTTSSTTLTNYRHTKEYNNVYQNVANIFDSDNKNKTNRDDINIRGIVSSEKPIMNDGLDVQHVNYSKNLQSSSNNVNYIDITQEFTCNTHYSQSQTIEMHMDAKYIHGIKRSLNNDTTKTETSIIKKRKDDIIILQDEVIKSKAKQTDDIINVDHNTQCQIKRIGNNLKEAGIPIESHIYTQEDIFSQDLPEVFIPSQNTQRFDGNDGFCFNNKTQNQILPLEIREVDFKNEKRKIANANNIIPKFNDYNERSGSNFANADTEIVENQLFATESQVLTITPLSVTNKNNNYEDSSGFPNCNKKAIYRNIDDKKCEENRKFYPDFDDSQSQSTLKAKETEFDQTLIITTNIKPNEEQYTQNIHKGCTDFDDNLQSMEEEQNAQPNDDYINFDDNLQDIEEDNSDTVKVPFKIIEELNKVKIYLNRRVERSQKENSGDTGYRSDISAKNSLKTSQSSVTRVDQSAHTLYSYITSCPMVSATQDIVREISIILGQLIDKLHGEEKYPAFLEELLDSIQTMLRLIYEDNSQLKTKDEYIHRIILLNRSVHIQRYTIEKITKNLENLYKQLTDKESEFELNNVDKLENMCHIFHLLEILLTKYSKNSANLSQNSESLTQNSLSLTQNSQSLTQNSQENAKTLKKSSIVDIWRKKWNANCKDDDVQNEGSQEKVCEIEKCCAVLNKIIVACFEGYSLVSYFALKCFNVLQK